MPTYGWLSLSLNLGLHRDFMWWFVVANNTYTLSNFGLLSADGVKPAYIFKGA
jgi:hypothetical protein